MRSKYFSATTPIHKEFFGQGQESHWRETMKLRLTGVFEMDIDFMLHTVMIYCPVCSRNVQIQAKQHQCISCCSILHVKCISLCTDDKNRIVDM